MKFSFDVGDKEHHRVDFSYNQFWGNLRITVDGESVVRNQSMGFSTHLVKRFEFTVGEKERHEVRIEQERELVMAGFRPKIYRVFVDGKQTESHRGY